MGKLHLHLTQLQRKQQVASLVCMLRLDLLEGYNQEAFQAVVV